MNPVHGLCSFGVATQPWAHAATRTTQWPLCSVMLCKYVDYVIEIKCNA